MNLDGRGEQHSWRELGGGRPEERRARHSLVLEVGLPLALLTPKVARLAVTTSRHTTLRWTTDGGSGRRRRRLGSRRREERRVRGRHPELNRQTRHTTHGRCRQHRQRRSRHTDAVENEALSNCDWVCGETKDVGVPADTSSTDDRRRSSKGERAPCATRPHRLLTWCRKLSLLITGRVLHSEQSFESFAS